MANQSIQSTDNSDWLGEVFRLTVFFVTPGKVDTSDWWQFVTGELPETRNSQPKIGVLQEEGEFNGGRLVLTTQPDRADWLFLPSFDKGMGMPDFGHLSPYTSSTDIFTKFALNWFTKAPPLSRIAFGMVLHRPVPDRLTGYRELAKYLAMVQIDPENSSDFLYQINRRRFSRIIPSLPLNRLTKWTVANIDSGQFAMGLGIPLQTVEFTNRHFVRLELDVNSAQEFRKQLPPDKIQGIFEELMNLAKELADKGDIP